MEKDNKKEANKNGFVETRPESTEPSARNSLPDWNALYSEMDVEDMPWYLPELDPDLQDALAKYHLVTGRFLDVGTGPGTQAIALSKMGFEVTGVDISAEAITKAQKLERNVKFIQDDILNTHMNKQFNLIFDRGCFHILDEDKRLLYISEIVKLLRAEGMLFLKCFSDKNPETGYGPYHFSTSMIDSLFSGRFSILEIKYSVYQSISNRQNQTLFVVMKKKEE